MMSISPKKLNGRRIITRPATKQRTPGPGSRNTGEDTSKLETVQEAVAAANAAADMSRRTWTHARQLMKDVHRSRGYFPVSKDKLMDVDQGKGKSRGKKGRFRKGKGKQREKGKGKSKGRRPGPCLLCQGPHWARDCPSHHGGKSERTVSSGKGY